MTLQEIIAEGLDKWSTKSLGGSSFTGGGSSSGGGFSSSSSPTMSGTSLGRPSSLTGGSFMSGRNRSVGETAPSVQDNLRGGISNAKGALHRVTSRPAGFPNQRIPTPQSLNQRVPKPPKLTTPMPSGMKLPTPPPMPGSMKPFTPATLKTSGIGQLAQTFTRGLLGGVRATGIGAAKLVGKLPRVIKYGLPAVGAIGGTGYLAARGLQGLSNEKHKQLMAHPQRQQRQQLYDTFRYGSGPSPTYYNQPAQYPTQTFPNTVQPTPIPPRPT